MAIIILFIICVIGIIIAFIMSNSSSASDTNTLKKLMGAKLKPNNRYHYSIYPAVEREYQASYSQLTTPDASPRPA